MMRFRRVSRAVAQSNPSGALEMVGDYGGFTYLVCKSLKVQADDAAIFQLALELDALFCTRHNPNEIDVRWGITNPWDEWEGTKPIEDGLWIHNRLIGRGVSLDHINAILSGVPSPPTKQQKADADSD